MYTDGSRYLSSYLGLREGLYSWVRPKVEAWDHGFRTLSKIVKQYPQTACSGLEMFLQLKWKYLQKNVPGVGTIMGLI